MKLPIFCAALAAATTLAVAIHWGTCAVGGSDSYCYVNEAALFASGRTRMDLPLAEGATWGSGAASFVPVGHLLRQPGPAAAPSPSAVPVCPPGLPLIMAGATIVAGGQAAFFVVPMLGALAIFLTFLLGSRLAGPVAGAGSAILLACSPIFLYQVVQPMTDVPAATWWLAAIVLASWRTMSGSTAAGAAAGVALLTRPNLFLLGPVLALYVALADDDPPGHAAGVVTWLRRLRWRHLTAFGVAALPCFVLLAWLQNDMYGAPTAVGYGRPGELYSLGNVLRNLRQYPAWLFETHTWLLALGPAAVLMSRFDPDNRPGGADGRSRRRLMWLCLGLSAAVLASYAPYFQFHDWWYIRFLLPAVPLLIVLLLSLISQLANLLPRSARSVAVAIIVVALGAVWVRTAYERSVFRLQEFQARFIEAGRLVDRDLPARSAVLTVSQSGSVRYYSGRPTLLWDALEPGDLDRALEFLVSRNHVPFILLEAEEEAAFKARFAGHSALGELDWPPFADVRTTVRVRIYDPADRARYFSGQAVITKNQWPDRAQRAR